MFLGGEDNFAALEAELAQIFGLFFCFFFCCLPSPPFLIALFTFLNRKEERNHQEAA